MNSSAPAIVAAWTISSRLASGLVAAMFSRTVPRNRKHCCITTPTWLRKCGRSSSRISWPSIRTEPSCIGYMPRISRVNVTAVRHGLCSCRPLHCEVGALRSAPVRLARRISVEGGNGLPRSGFRRGGSSQQLGDGAALHEVGPDQPGEGERAFDNAVGFVSQAQQYEG